MRQQQYIELYMAFKVVQRMHFCLLEGGKGITKQLLRRHPLVDLLLKCPLQEGMCPFCKPIGKKLLWFERLQLNQKIFLCLRFPRILANQHFEEGHPDGPDIAFEAILILSQRFVWHIERRSNIFGQNGFAFFRIEHESEIPNEQGVIEMDEDVGGLNVPMDEIVGMDGSIAIDDLLQIGNRFLFLEFTLFPYQLTQRTFLAQLRYQID